VVPYVFDAGLSAAQQQIYLAGLREYELAANVQFIPRTTQTQYVLFKYVQYGPNRVSGSQPQVVEIGSLTRVQICHEMGHSFGLEHEHQRPDRDTYIDVVEENIFPGSEYLFEIAPGTTAFGPYDFESVMHYGRDAVSKQPGLDTIQTKAGFTKFQPRLGNQTLSPGDRALMAFLYGPPAVAPSAVVTTTSDGGAGSLRAAIYYAQDHPGTPVTFNIPTSDPGHSAGVFTIRPTAFLPLLATDGVVIDGTTQPGFAGQPVVFLDGSAMPEESGDAPAFLMLESGCQVKGLGVIRFPWCGIVMDLPDATGNVVSGCWIGLNAAGSAAPNVKQGIQVSNGASGNLIGGTTVAARNVLSGNGEYGIWMSGSGTAANRVLGNYIGTNPAGNAAVANQVGGVIVTEGAHDQVIGSAAAGNVISGNQTAGLFLTGAGVTNNSVCGNFFGTDATGSASVPNTFAGVYLIGGCSANRLGDGPGSGNLISGNGGVGVLIADAATHGNFVRNNRIGPAASGAFSFTNQFNGISIQNGAQSSVIGGSGPGAANVIAGNTSSGIGLYDAGTTGHEFTRNSIHGNGWLGISLNNGSNGGQLAPVLDSATLGITTRVTGSLNGTANAGYELELFSSGSVFPPSGRHFIGRGSVTANGSGVATIDLVLSAPVPAGQVITATARGGSGTSEFSNGVPVTTIDSDGDGLPDAYESTIPGLSSANSADAAEDFDNDGLSNLDEFLAGTAPRDPASRLFATGLQSGGDFVVSFPSILGLTYGVNAADNLSGPWTSEAIHLFGTGGTMSVTMPAHGPRRFFRVVSGP